MVGDPQPFGDDCSSRVQVQNIGDLLNAKSVTWGYSGRIQADRHET